jgi:hypothetical protein
MLISLSLAEVFEEAFGRRTEAYNFPPVADKKRFTDQGNAYYAVDAQGREYYMPVKLGDVQLSYPVVSWRVQNVIVETPLTERRGTVTELISIDNYIITIRGVIYSKDKSYPEKEVRQLRELVEKKEALSISSPMTDIILVQPDRAGYDKVVIRSLEMPEVRGVVNARAYMIELKSDEAFSLIEL